MKASAVNVTEIDYADIPELSDDWFDRASRGFHVQAKKPVSLRLDEDILVFLRCKAGVTRRALILCYVLMSSLRNEKRNYRSTKVSDFTAQII